MTCKTFMRNATLPALAIILLAVYYAVTNHQTGMVNVPEGQFEMGYEVGLPDEKTVHTVELDAYSIDKYEVTNSKFVEFLNEMHAEGNIRIERALFSDGDTCLAVYLFGQFALLIFEEGINQTDIQLSENLFTVTEEKSDLPVNVTWSAANSYCTHHNKRLPTEAEWEYAARGGPAGENYLYSGSDDPDVVGWHRFNSSNHSHPVGQKEANSLGIYDMSGNAREWVSDWYSPEYYLNSPVHNPQGPSQEDYDIMLRDKVLRGGSWYEAGSESEERIDPALIRVTKRDFLDQYG